MELRRTNSGSLGEPAAVPSLYRLAGRRDADVVHGERRDERPGDLRRYWQILRSQWLLIGATLGFVVAAVAIGTLFQTRVYRATGVLEIRAHDAAVVPVEALFQTERLSTQYLETQYGILRSSALIHSVIADLGLLEVEEFNPEEGASFADSTAVLLRATEVFRERLIVDPVTGSHLVRIYFEAEDPQLAARVVNSLLDQYRNMRVQGGRSAVTRLSEQLESVRDRLALSEERLQEYVRSNGLLLMEDGDGSAESIPEERLRHLQQQLTEAEADRYTKESLYSFLEAQSDGMLDSEVLRSLNVRVAELRGEYAKLRATFTDEYPRTREARRELDQLEAEAAAERERIREEISGDFFAAVERQNLLQTALEAQRAEVDELADRTAEYRIRAREVETHEQLYAMLQQQVREAEVSAALATTDIAIVDRADPPLAPIRPVPLRNLQLGLLVGLFLGIGLAFLRDYVDPTIRRIEELDGLPVPLLGMIPSISSLEVSITGALQQLQERGKSPASALAPVTTAESSWPRIDRDGTGGIVLEDAFGSLRAAVLFEADASDVRALLITSALPGEGKTTVCINLALSLARLGRRVLVIDADVRRPSVHRAFEIPAGPGLGDVLGLGGNWEQLVHRGAAPGVDMLPAGAPVAAPADLLSSPRMRDLMREAQARYDFVLLDSPALAINAADTRVLAPLVGGVVVVIRSGATPRELVGRVLGKVPNLIGVVLNDLDPRHLPAYYGPVEEAVQAAGDSS